MPYEIKHNIPGCSNYAVVLKTSGKIVTCHPDKQSALKHLAALEINVEEAKIEKSDGHVPTDSMVAAAKRALEWKKQGNAGGTNIGLGRAHQIVNRENLSESTVKRMYSFFSRHEVDKKAEGFSSGEKGFPSPGRVAWDLWGGDAGFSWSRQKVTSMQKLFMYGGSTEFKVEYNVPDCQGGWAVLKDGTGQVVGCYKTEAEANKHKEDLSVEMTDILGDEVRTSKSPQEYAESQQVKKEYSPVSIWDGVFFPSQKGVMGPDTGSQDQDAGWASTFNTPPQKDSKPSTGYGNRSSGTNPK